MISSLLVLLIAVLHAYFMVLEMFLWQKPFGLRTFKMSASQAQTTAVLAMNQGFYNGILAAGLMCGLFLSGEAGNAFKYFFATSALAAGLFGAFTVQRKIFWIQGFPALLALIFLTLGW